MFYLYVLICLCFNCFYLCFLRANEEIATVRAKASSENMALTASLRKEQMKNESLEQALQQKVKANLMNLLTILQIIELLLNHLCVFAEPGARGTHKDL